MPLEVNDDRYSRFELISWWNQDILKNARIIVAGCGALGNEIIKNLAMLGVGHIFAVDMDNVEKSNLSRSVLFRKEDEGKSKAEVICKRALEINDEIDIRYFNGNIFSLGLGVFRNSDLIIGGLDNREARLFINQSCWKVSRPWIDGAIEVLTGVARMFIPPLGSCYECTMSETDYKLINKRKSCMLLGIDEIAEGKIPTTPTIASVIAGVQVQEAVKYLHNRDDLTLLNGRGFIFNGNNNDSYIVEYQRIEECPSHYTFDNILKPEIKFDEVTINDLIQTGKKYFNSDDFVVEFNNEIVYELSDENNKPVKELFANLNLMSVKDVKTDDGRILNYKSFHNFSSASGIAERFSGMKIIDLGIPLNDIIVLRKDDKEVQLEFNEISVFK